MAENTMNRRKWLRSSALLAGGATVLPSVLNSLTAAPLPAAVREIVTDESVILNAAPQIKARLSANENPFGPSPKAKQAIKDSLDMSYQYAFTTGRELTQKIAAYEGVKPEQVMLAAGSSPLLQAAAMYFSPKGTIITGDPSYNDLPDTAEKDFGAKVVRVPLTADYKLDLDAMEKKIDSSTALVYICNPNNPTGTVLDAAKLKAFTERVSKKVSIFIDEAYIDYLPDPKAATLLENVKKGQNVIVARTFSKLYGFAGLRVGYAIAQPEMAKTLGKYSSGGGCISATSLSAALASYQDQAFLQDALKKTMASKNFLYDVLKKEGYKYIPSGTNFVMFPINMDGRRFGEEMGKRGVSIRTWNFNNQDWCRVSIGRMDEMQTFADAFKQIS
ncbi:pyridoxal phosphate-dependent aminotransferase [Pontibacter harenae]|uniref:pyridoxal phosphate-dependent aminotransferase n=1 Tax=Pontibacter harenae TaxID=2894083 RepID=UPI001E3CF818|nr:histidinol-phosphate transaminase [Pontibacter harenae]MCC9166494.1 histidinol-phosphate aminotransferase family protein [Pontibacter harenae]